MHILFADGALRDASWGGYIWLYLPFKFHLSAAEELQIMKLIDISGSASCAGIKQDESGIFLFSNLYSYRCNLQVYIVTVVEIVRHGLSDVKGAVVKIPVGMNYDGYGNNAKRDLSITWMYDIFIL